MTVVVIIALVAVFVGVPVLLWRSRRSRLGRGLADAGTYYNSVLGLGGAPARDDLPRVRQPGDTHP